MSVPYLQDDIEEPWFCVSKYFLEFRDFIAGQIIRTTIKCPFVRSTFKHDRYDSSRSMLLFKIFKNVRGNPCLSNVTIFFFFTSR